MKKRIISFFLTSAGVLLTVCLGLYLRFALPGMDEGLRSSAIAYGICGYLLLLICSALAAFLAARRITAPIQAIDPRHPEHELPYAELMPLMQRLQEQNRTIREQNSIMTRERQDFAAVTENMNEGFLLLDKRLNIVSGNHAARQYFWQDEKGKTDNLNSNGCPEEIRTAAAKAVAGQRLGLTVSIKGRYLYVVASPVYSESSVSGAVILLLDTTEQEERNLLRREFTANVSHELKTPLTSINGFAELLKSGMVDAEHVPEFAEDIYRESQRLIQLVNDILELGRLEEEHTMPVPEAVDLFALAEATVSGMQTIAEKASVTLRLRGDHAVIMGNRTVLQEMISNLCDNAVKYNRAGGEATVSITETDHAVVLAVEDTGIGIPAEHQNRVFERFYRVDKSHSRAIGGTGLGLSIVKHGAVLHRAQLELYSVPDKGTTISVRFPKGG